MSSYLKLVVFVPLTHLAKVRSAIFSAGGGKIGKKYDQCSFFSIGTGTFRPRPGAKPYLGNSGKLKRVEEARLEAIVPKKALNKIIKALKKAHPYEIPAYDIYPIIRKAN
jgi:hypothetical protein